MGTTTFPSEREDSSGLPAPCFSDVLEAQRWAVEVVRHAEAEACRRGMRGSPAWEDAWRDALWTLAVQKRCVEVEARKCCAAKRDAIRDGSLAMEARCAEMRQRLEVLEDRLQVLSHQLEVLLDGPPRAPRLASPATPQRARPAWAELRPVSAPELSGLSFLDDEPRDGRIQELQRQLSNAEAERLEAARRLVSMEAELAMLKETLRSSEAKLQESYRKLEESESTWRQRHSALQRQLQRTERQLSARAATYGFVAELPKHIYGDRPESKRTPFCVRLLSPDLISAEDTKSWEVEYSLREIRTATIRQAVETDMEGLRKSVSTGRWDDLT
eukprot:symbB.v1.2.027028.t1/scaffold2740.1/size71859/5